MNSELNSKLLAALIWAEQNCSPKTKEKDALHVGFWRRYNLCIFMSQDSTLGQGLKFIDQPGVREFLAIIDYWFKFIDPELYEQYCRITPDAPRVLGESFLMAVLNRGGSDPHIDSEDRVNGCCCVVPVGSGWSGGALAFRDLHLLVNCQPGDVLFFRSAQLYHENLDYIGDRRSIVLNSDANCFTASGQFLNPDFLKDECLYNEENGITLPPAPEWTEPQFLQLLDTDEKRHSYLRDRLQLRAQNNQAKRANVHKLKATRPDWHTPQFNSKDRSDKKKAKRHRNK